MWELDTLIATKDGSGVLYGAFAIYNQADTKFRVYQCRSHSHDYPRLPTTVKRTGGSTLDNVLEKHRCEFVSEIDSFGDGIDLKQTWIMPSIDYVHTQKPYTIFD
jgi:hypothetical protein